MRYTNARPYSKEMFINKIKTDDEFVNKWGELGPIYGKQWRSWETTNVRCRKFEEIYNMSDDSVVVEKNTIDQIANLISELKTNPDSRRLMVNAWNVGELDQPWFSHLVIMDFKFIRESLGWKRDYVLQIN